MPPPKSADRLRRLLVLVPWVIANPGRSVDEVCRRFGITRAELTADIELLFMCGLPPFGPGDLIEASIDGDEVVIKWADYLARPARLTRTEAIGLLVMGRAMLPVLDDEQGAPLARALDKLSAAIAPGDADRAREAAAHVAVELTSAGAEHLDALRAAADERARVTIVYHSHGRDEITERAIDPLVVFPWHGNWYVAAQDHDSGDERVFRVDRVKELQRTGESFEPPAGFDPQRFARGWVIAPSGDLDVVVDVGPSAAWLREVIQPQHEEDLANGWVRVRLRTPHLPWLVRLLLSAGPGARAVSPPQLGEAVRDAAARALGCYA